MKKIFFLVILFIGFFLRFNNLNWDNYQHLHPDERFLTMVGNAMKLPKTFQEYLDPKTSTLNPANIGYNFFVYGSFPLVLNKILAVTTKSDDYNFFTIQGRMLSAFFDFLIIILVYKTAKLLLEILKQEILKQEQVWDDNKKKIIDYFPFFAAFFYATSVYPIQSAHFFTTDTFLNFFMFSSFYFVLKSYNLLFNKNISHSIFYVIFSGIFFGLALACKISAFYILPLNLGVIFLSEILKQTQNDKKQVRNNKNGKFIKIFLYFTFQVICYILSAYFTLRLANPYYFASNNFFDFKLDQRFVSSIESLKYFTQKDAWYPPGVQWINKPWWALLSTTFFVGLGPVNFIVMIIGLIYLIFNFQFSIFKQFLNFKKIKKEIFLLILIIFWMIGYFVYQSLQFIKSIRYIIYLYPFFAIFGGLGIIKFKALISKFETIIKPFKNLKFKKLKFISNFKFQISNLILIFILLIWPLLFSTIYFRKNTRVEASEWIYQSLPDKSVILGEHWDDPLPLYVSNPLNKTFQIELLPIFDPDTSEKWQKMKELLSKADYYVLSS
ncbi:MAG: hypothetical protein N2Z85_01325, partial [Patescibacteria group bacterium]|nr:hypothetical protein [Patescibacteria group bacterium]